nr:MAG TPA: hypothetical protein [Caudoviricetes sp.]
MYNKKGTDFSVLFYYTIEKIFEKIFRKTIDI